jgi:hypothetical protein
MHLSTYYAILTFGERSESPKRLKVPFVSQLRAERNEIRLNYPTGVDEEKPSYDP